MLAVDPSSSVSGGSVLGDKTRMEELARHPHAFIRPSPSSGALGGVAAHTREAMLFVEAAGFDVVIVETVGVGQSETDVANLTDVFVLMQLPNAGDDLQAIKKGIVELADIIVYNKRDLDPRGRGPRDGADGRRADAAAPGVRALEAAGARRERAARRGHRRVLARGRCAAATRYAASGELAAKRRRQALAWTWHLIDAGLRERFRGDRARARRAAATSSSKWRRAR